jgi:hypothetical protein
MDIGQLVFIIVLVLGFLIPPALFGQWWLFGVFLLFFCCFGVVEWLAVKKTGQTVSQKFWALRKRNPKGAWFIVIGMQLAWWALIFHFMFQGK